MSVEEVSGIYNFENGQFANIVGKIVISKEELVLILNSGKMIENPKEDSYLIYKEDPVSKGDNIGNTTTISPEEIRSLMFSIREIGGTEDWEHWRNKPLHEVIKTLKPNGLKLKFENTNTIEEE